MCIIQILGIEPCLSRVNDLIKEALRKADLNNDIKLNGLVCIHLKVILLHKFCLIIKYIYLQGLSLSGCEDQTFCKTFENKLLECYPDLTDEVIVVSDTLAPIALACESGI